jgi:hypothetical protein
VGPTGATHDLPSMDYMFLSSYPGAIGIKTGFTDRAGDCLLAAAHRHGRTMIAVVMDGYNPTQTAIDLLDQGFATPVGDEATFDRLPPVRLPGPRFAPERAQASNPGSLQRPERATARRGHPPSARSGLGGAAGLSRQLRAEEGRLPAQVSKQAARQAPRGLSAAAGYLGLRPVLGSWPAQLLLSFAALTCLFAFWETARANKSRRKRVLEELRRTRARGARAPSD